MNIPDTCGDCKWHNAGACDLIGPNEDGDNWATASDGPCMGAQGRDNEGEDKSITDLPAVDLVNGQDSAEVIRKLREGEGG